MAGSVSDTYLVLFVVQLVTRHVSAVLVPAVTSVLNVNLAIIAMILVIVSVGNFPLQFLSLNFNVLYR